MSHDAACSAYGCEPGQCTCADAQSRNTRSCRAPAASCTCLGPNDECIESYAAAWCGSSVERATGVLGARIFRVARA